MDTGEHFLFKLLLDEILLGQLINVSIPLAQKYYDLLTEIKNGNNPNVKISEDVTKALPDFPKFAITYSISENEERSQVDQGKMKASLADYNDMFGTHFGIEEIGAYNSNLNDRLARKEKKYLNREQQLDIVIVVDRLLTGFDAPCLSTLFMDRPPMNPQNIIQAFSRTNRLFDEGKQYGQVVTFQSPKEFKDAINNALILYSRGGDGNPLAEDWETAIESFVKSLKSIRELAQTPKQIVSLSKEQKKAFVQLFRALDHDFAHIKAFSTFDENILDEYDFSEEDYENYAAMYKNVMEELKSESPDNEDDDDPVYDDYDLIAYSRMKIDFEYIVELLQGFVESLGEQDDEPFDSKIQTIRSVIKDFSHDNPKMSALLNRIVDDIEANPEEYVGKDISVIINEMRQRAVDVEIEKFANKWYLAETIVRYEVYNYRFGQLANENKLKDSADYATYKSEIVDAMPKFKFRKMMVDEFKVTLMPEITPLID